MEINRTAVVKLSVPSNRRDDLKRTMNTFLDATQRFADRGWDGDDDGYVITSGETVYRPRPPVWQCCSSSIDILRTAEAVGFLGG